MALRRQAQAQAGAVLLVGGAAPAQGDVLVDAVVGMMVLLLPPPLVPQMVEWQVCCTRLAVLRRCPLATRRL